MHALWTYYQKRNNKITCIPHTLQVIGTSPSTDVDNNSEHIWHNFCFVSGSSSSLFLTWCQKLNVFSSSFVKTLSDFAWDAFLRGMDLWTLSKKTLDSLTNRTKRCENKIENDKCCFIKGQLNWKKQAKVMKYLLQRTRVAGMNALYRSMR